MVVDIRTAREMVDADRQMLVRGAPLIGAAAYGMALGMREASSDNSVARLGKGFLDARPTAVNLRCDKKAGGCITTSEPVRAF